MINKKFELMVIYLMTMMIAVMGGIYLMAPFYQFICSNSEYFNLIWSFLFQTNLFETVFDLKDNLILKVSFHMTVSDDLPWQCSMDLAHGFCNMGEPLLSTIKMSNVSDETITAIALVDIMPSEYKGYFNKQQCFCYEPMRLFPWETVYLPIIFNILPDLYQDFQFGLSSSVIILYSFISIGW